MITKADRYIKYGLIVPMVALIGFIAIYPFVYAIYLSFTNAGTSNYLSPNFVGINNYIELFTSTFFYKSLLISLIYVGGVVGAEAFLGLFLAVIVYNYVRRGNRIIVSCLIVPLLISPMTVGILYRLQLNAMYGIIPYYLEILGFTKSLLVPGMALWTVMFIDIWQWTSFVFLITYAGLHSIPAEPFEASQVDGASGWQTFKIVTFPLVKPFFLLAIIFRVMDAFKTFDHIYILTSGGPSRATMTLSLFTYDLVYRQDSYGLGAALSIILLIVIILICQRILYFTPGFKEKFKKIKV